MNGYTIIEFSEEKSKKERKKKSAFFVHSFLNKYIYFHIFG